MNRLMTVALVLCVTSSMGCAGATATQQDTPKEPQANTPLSESAAYAAAQAARQAAVARNLWERSIAAREAGDEVAARRVLMRLVREVPGASLNAAARVQLGDDALSRRDWSGALSWVEPLGRMGAIGFGRFRVIALAHEGQTSYAEAAEAWLAASRQASDEAKRRAAIDGAAQDLYLGGDLHEARRLAATLGPEGAGLRERVAPRLDGTTLQSLAGSVATTDPDTPWLSLLNARARCASGELGPCRRSAEIAAGSAEAEIAEEARRLLERVEAWDEVHPSKLGVLLPLSGPFQAHGQAALEGIQQALANAPHVDLVVRDTAGQAGLAAQGAQELILDEHVAAILGPIGELESRAAVTSAARFQVPHLVLSSSPEVCANVPTALRIRLSAGEKVEALARYAVTELGVRRAALLVPQQKARRQQMAAFWDELVRLGGEVRSVASYAPKQRDFKPIIGELLGADKPGKGTVDFDALFIPDDALEVRRLVPFLKYYGVRVKTRPSMKSTRRSQAVQLLGVEAWNSSAVIDAEGLTDNAVFVDTFFHDPDDRPVDHFVRAFYARHRRKPNAFQAEVYDAVNLLASAMKQAGGAAETSGADQATRDGLLEALLATKHHRGVTGHITVLDDGTMVLQPRVLTVHLEDIRLRVSEDEEAVLRRGVKRTRGRLR